MPKKKGLSLSLPEWNPGPMTKFAAPHYAALKVVLAAMSWRRRSLSTAKLHTETHCCLKARLDSGNYTLVPLKRRCSKKCAVPFVASVSKRLPELIHTPTVVVSAKGMTSVATRMPLGRTVT